MRRTVLLFLLPVLLLTACSGSPPGIVNTDWRVVYARDLVRGTVWQELNFFVQVDDEDGEEDLAEIYLIRDDLGWSWKLDPETWQTYSRDGEFWVGSNGLCLSGGDSLPGGDYRLLVIDRSGQRNELTVTVRQPGVDMNTLAFPGIALSGEYIRIESDREPLVLWFYNDMGDLVAEKYTGRGTFPLTDFLSSEERQQVTWMYVYLQEEQEGYGMKSGPYLLDGP